MSGAQCLNIRYSVVSVRGTIRSGEISLEIEDIVLQYICMYVCKTRTFDRLTVRPN